MLVLSRKRDESIFIDTSDGPIIIVISAILGDRVNIGFEAPKHINIVRDELRNNDETSQVSITDKH